MERDVYIYIYFFYILTCEAWEQSNHILQDDDVWE